MEAEKKYFEERYTIDCEKPKNQMVDELYRVENVGDFKISEAPELVIFHHVIMSGGDNFNRLLKRTKELARRDQATGQVKTSYTDEFQNCLLATDAESKVPNVLLTSNKVAFSRGAGLVDLDDKLFISGHDIFGIHQFLPKPCSYFGLLRNPIDLFLSRFIWREHFPGPDGSRVTGWQSVEKWFDELSEISGHLNQQCCEYSRFRSLEQPIPEFWDENINDLYEKSKNNLQSLFFLVGIKELYEETIFMLFSALGIPATPMWRPGLQNFWRPRRDDLPIRILRKLERLMEADITLYSDFREQFENNFYECEFGEQFNLYKERVRLPHDRLYLELIDRLDDGYAFGPQSPEYLGQRRHVSSVAKNIVNILE